jgi:hypothetical protein
MSWCYYEAEESKDEDRRHFKAANKDSSPSSDIVNKKPFWIFYYSLLALESKSMAIGCYLASLDYF